MLKKDFKKFISTAIAATMIISCSAPAFAENTNTSTQTETTTPSEPTTPTQPDTSDNEAVNMDLSARAVYVYNEDDDTYSITVSSVTELDNLRNFAFSISTSDENAAIKEYSFGEKLQSSNEELTITNGKKTVKFAKGADTVAVSGTPVLCTVVLDSTSAPTAETLSITDFTASNNDDKQVNITVTLEVIEQPTMSEDASEVYTALKKLPTPDTLSFYDDKNNLVDIEKLSDEVSSTAAAYDKLSADDKKSVQDTFMFNNEVMPDLDGLKKLTSDMSKTSDVIILAMKLNAIDEKDLINYRFLTNTYTSEVLPEINEAKLTFGTDSVLKTQYEKAKSDITAKSEINEKAYKDMGVTSDGFSSKIEMLDTQLENIQTMSTDKYYKSYLVDLNNQADAVLNELKAYDNETFKDKLIEGVNDCIDKIEAVQNGLTSLPTVEFPTRIDLKHSYKIQLKRDRKSAVEAQVKIVVFEEDDTENEIASKTFDYEEGKSSLEASMTAGSAYPRNENVDVYVYYIISGAEFLIDSDTIRCKVAAATDKAPGIPTGGNSGGSGSSGSSGNGGTRFPEANNDIEDEDDNKKDEVEEAPLFEDIENYGWAQEAIEGLYHAGIINGMEEGIFNPAGNVTREQFCKMVVQLFDVSVNETDSDFNDVIPTAWYAPYVCSAVRAGYVQGQSDDYFGIGESIMRQDMATILYRAIGNQNSKAVLDFTDVDAVAPYAEDAVSELVGLEIINGYDDGSFKPRGTATRAEAAKVIWGVYNLINE